MRKDNRVTVRLHDDHMTMIDFIKTEMMKKDYSYYAEMSDSDVLRTALHSMAYDLGWRSHKDGASVR